MARLLPDSELTVSKISRLRFRTARNLLLLALCCCLVQAAWPCGAGTGGMYRSPATDESVECPHCTEHAPDSVNGAVACAAAETSVAAYPPGDTEPRKAIALPAVARRMAPPTVFVRGRTVISDALFDNIPLNLRYSIFLE